MSQSTTSVEDMGRQMMEMMRAFQASTEAQTRAYELQIEALRGRNSEAPVERIEKPATFSGVEGKDESNLSTFLSQCENQFRYNPRSFSTEGSKVGFAISLLRGRAGEVITAIQADETRQEVVESWSSFKEYLDSTFGDPDRKNAARRALQHLEQTGTASQYFVEVERLAGIMGWTTKDTQAVLVGQVERGLKTNLQLEIAKSGRHFESVRELSDYVVPLDERLHAFEVEEAARRGRRIEESRIRQEGFVRGDYRQGAAPRPMGPVRAYSAPQNAPQGFPLRFINGVWRNLSSAEFANRRDNRLCFTCGASNHRSPDCDKVPPTVATVPQINVKPENSGAGKG